LPAASRN
jgi:hypothetical protein